MFFFATRITSVSVRSPLDKNWPFVLIGLHIRIRGTASRNCVAPVHRQGRRRSISCARKTLLGGNKTFDSCSPYHSISLFGTSTPEFCDLPSPHPHTGAHLILRRLKASKRIGNNSAGGGIRLFS